MDCHLQGEQAAGCTQDDAVRTVTVTVLIGAHRGFHRWQSIEGFGNGLCLLERCRCKMVVLIPSIFGLEVAGNAHPDALAECLGTAVLDNSRALDEEAHCRGYVDGLDSTGLEDSVVEDSCFVGKAENRHSY